MNDHTTDLVKSLSIANLTNQRTACMERIQQALTLLSEARDIAIRAHLTWPRIEVNPHGRHHGVDMPSDEALESIRRCIDAGGWAYLMHESGLRTFMDAQARSEWDTNLYEGKDIPELTADNVAATFAVLHERRSEMFDRGVLNCFRRLSWDYKTNSPRKFGKRIIVKNLVEMRGPYRWFSHHVCDQLDDLARIFHLVDGRPEPDHRNGYQERLNATTKDATEIEDDYCTLRWYKGGTGHLMFKRHDLVERLNQILTTHHPNALPPA